MGDMKRLIFIFMLILTVIFTLGCTSKPDIDTDGDGWVDELELKAGTDPTNKDTDGDGLWDPHDPNPLVPEKIQEAQLPAQPETSAPPETSLPTTDAPQSQTTTTTVPTTTKPSSTEPPIRYPTLDDVKKTEQAIKWEYSTRETIYNIAVASDTGYVAAGTKSGVILIDDKGELVFKYPITGGIPGVSISSNGDYMVAGGQLFDGNVYLLDKEGNLLWRYYLGDVGDVNAISANGDFIVSGSKKGVIVFNKSGDILKRLFDYRNPTALAISPDGRYLAIGTEDGKVALMEGEDDPLWEWSYGAIKNRILDIDVSRDGRYVIAGAEIDDVLIFDSTSYGKSSKLITRFKTQDNPSDVLISKDSSFFAAYTQDDRLYYFNMSGKKVFEKKIETPYPFIILLPDGSYAASDNRVRTIYFFNP
jgi:WD40 repeat protein